MSDAWVRLAHVGMHADRLRRLVDDMGSPDDVVRAIVRGTINVPDWARAAAGVSAARRRAELDEAGIRLLLRQDDDFPARLAELPDTPPFLFQLGRSFTGLAVAIVGTRSCTSYGRRLAEAYGALGIMVDERSQVDDAIDQALNAGRTTVIDFRVDPREQCYPMIPAGAAALELIEFEEGAETEGVRAL